MRKKILFSFFLCSFLLCPQITYAQSSYVLPYPSAMPGSFWYKVQRVFERVEPYWYFGNFSQYTYNLKKSDKYLVEAKTLFEYKQYLLADQALQRSDAYFEKIYPSLEAAKREGKDISEKERIFLTAAEKHNEVLQSLLVVVPKDFTWSPEKQTATALSLHAHINRSIELRRMKQ